MHSVSLLSVRFFGCLENSERISGSASPVLGNSVPDH
jgi:hypothetical protein